MPDSFKNTEDMTANKLYKSAVEKGLTNVSFSKWIENKNAEYALYVKKLDGENKKPLSFEAWEYKNQNPAKKSDNKNVINGLIFLALAAGLIYVLNNKNIMSKIN